MPRPRRATDARFATLGAGEAAGVASGAERSNTVGVHLLHRKRDGVVSLDESDCYAHSYREHRRGHVDPIPVAPPAPAPEILWDLDPPRHVTTEALKRQFEERLEARKPRLRRTTIE